MTIRLTSVEAFDKVLEKLKRDKFYHEEENAMFFNHSVPIVREGIAKGDDEYYLDAEWFPHECYGLVIRWHKRSEIMTDVEYLNEESNDRETT